MQRCTSTDDPLALIQYLDLKTYLVGDINTKVDRASMAHSLEVREPLMDHPLVEWLGSLPSSLKVRGRRGQVAAQEGDGAAACRDEILYRPKMGFAVPLARWFRGPLRDRVRDALHGERLLATGIFEPRVPAAAGRRSPGRCTRLQRAAVDAPDVRRVPAQRRRPGHRPPARSNALHDERRQPCASCTSSIIRCRCTAAMRSAPRAILREQRALGWETLQLTTPRQQSGSERRGSRRLALPSHAPGTVRTRFAAGRRLPARDGGDAPAHCRPRARRSSPTCCTRTRRCSMRCPRCASAGGSRLPVVYELRALWEDAAVDHGTTRDGSLRYRASRALETFALRRVDHVTTICDGLRDEIVARGVAPSTGDGRSRMPSICRSFASASRRIPRCVRG